MQATQLIPLPDLARITAVDQTGLTLQLGPVSVSIMADPTTMKRLAPMLGERVRIYLQPESPEE